MTARKYGILFSDSAWRHFSGLPSEEMGRVGRALEWLARRGLTGLPDDDRALRVVGIEGKYTRDRRNKLLKVNALNVRGYEAASNLVEAVISAVESSTPG